MHRARSNNRDPRRSPQDLWADLTGVKDFHTEVSPLPSSRLSTADSNKVKYYASMIPFFGDILKAVARSDEIYDYMDKYGLTWETINPWNAADSGLGSAAQVVRAGYSFVSKNIGKMYRK